jgi:hypothetical protein
VNFTASLVQPPQDYNLYCDPDDASSVGRYIFDGIIRQDGVSQATFNAISASEFNQFPTASFLNPMTWATCSFELTASLTASAEPTGTLCYEIETVQSAPGECFDCPGFFAVQLILYYISLIFVVVVKSSLQLIYLWNQDIVIIQQVVY